MKEGGGASTDKIAPADNSALGVRVNNLYDELKKMATKDDLNYQAEIFDRKIKALLEKIEENRDKIDILQRDHDGLNSSYDNFVEKIFFSATERITSLEKKVSSLYAKKSQRGGNEP